MNIEDGDDGARTTVTWRHEGESVSVTLPSPADAAYADPVDVIVAADGDGRLHVLEPDGALRDSFEYDTPDGCDRYVLVSSIATKLGVTMVLAHDPPHQGETLWQHEIDLEGRAVGGPVARWR
ncbi:hypothetical protein [Haloarchaeobius baliensis]|uniref:hypothetical protein n=1 Tax=Haloarchaeobius baliensis TaxID=1670458 RepID=UPI003F881611